MPRPVAQPPPPPPPPPTPPQVSLTEPVLPIDTLSSFLDEVRGLLDNVVYYWDQLLFKRDIRASLRAAWNALRQRIAGGWASLTDAPGAGGYTARLSDAGLDGAQLALKLRVLSDTWKRFHERGTVPLLRDVLEW